ncbi:tRNA lysidine(34) synthetase TilS [Bradyrhizobium sp. 180]|uniref:tRNA lysidine(34) synthetase TilS n=1 Tax=unclassified Bradyrhizobium TaxID=2631580 RepID=UPI001FFC14AC|nr:MULTISPECIES: tRNA lysidine(34) synthetase TilS [unclassified Bradyrhizobium]MCK1423850.1 tRNA lysidine(34) synthetase TilS [Bradyrhizobium sp. CW12]MCK1495344.1 tRNA lysidine(34) synthetase TilS [Bradyrhizobium sp. 180]MCK1526378.1 tRNA lysidine(34) synthetase TilS [Bradyrhizobium sp. 182]MCK1597502.1 tRNA lysidine(34) synthetase TilS [Bradyrhizobium sp. 164]MCK1643683.1 tRNA lysidine(34) synthetase TilS [Bradyrhizobium sp. 154]
MSDDDNSPISAREARRLFAGLKTASALVLAVSGGPDSVALMWLAARWRRSLARGPQLTVVTVDHGLRPEAAREAREVKRLAAELGLPHRTLRWRGAKPKTGLPAAAREARYRLLAQAARAVGARHVLTAHTRDDQAETLLMRMLRGSGLAGLSAMAGVSERDGIVLARPLLDVPKAQLIATLKRAKVGFADDPSNRDTAFTRPRLRALLPQLAAEGGDARTLVRLASRLARANAAVEVLADGAERFLRLRDRDVAPQAGVRSFEASAFAALPEEVRLRLLLRAIDALGYEGPAELGKVESLMAVLDRAIAAGPRAAANGRPVLKQTLAGALISLAGGRIRIAPAPSRRRKGA